MSLDPKNIQEMRRVAQSAFDANVDKSTLINDLSKDGWGALYLDEAALYYDGLKKKVQKQPVAAGVSPSTSAKPVSLSELVPIKGDDTPPYLQQKALKQQEILQEVEKAPAVQKNIAKKNLFNKYEGAISTVDSLDKSGETDEAKYRGALSGLSDAYDNYKQKNPDVDLPNFYDARGGVNPDALSYIEKDRTDTIASEEESRFKSEARRSNFLEAGVKQLAGGILGLVGMAHKYMPNPAIPYDVAMALKKNNLLLEKGDEITSQAQREMIGRRLEAGYTQEQIDSGFIGEAAKGNYVDALGLLGQDMLDQTVNFVMTAINPAIGLGVLGASAGGSAYLQVKDDDRYSDAEKIVYASALGAIEPISELLFPMDINMSKAMIKSLIGKAGVKKVSDIPKKEFADMLFGRLPKVLRAPLEEGTEELLVGVVQQSLDKIMADEPFKPVELAEAAILGASMGEGVFVLHKGPSAIGKIADLNQTISIRDRVDKINTLLQDPNITDEERNVLTNRLKVAKKEEERIMNNAAIFYANYSQEDAKATLEANQKLSSLLKSADKVKSEEGRAGIIDEIKTQIDTLKQIESKYDSKKGQQVPGAVQAGAQLGGIQQPGEGTEAAAPGGVLQTPEQEALASRVSAADSSAPKLGFKMKTPKRVPLNKDTAPEVYRSLLEAVDNYSDETLAQMQTTREEVREGVKSLFDVVSSLTKSGRDVSVDVYGSVADLNKGLGVSVKKQGREYVVSNEDGTEFYRTNKKKDADRWMGTFQTRGVYVGRNPQDGVTNVAILMPAMVANTGYHEGLHDVIPYVFGDVEISKIARAMAKATKSSARLSDKMLRFIQSYERDGEATQNDEFLTELASLISSGEIEVEVKDSIIDRFMKGLSDILGNPDFLKRKPSTEQFVRLLNEIAKRIGEGRELSVDISKGEVSSPRSQKVYADVVDGFYSPIENRILETKADKQSATKWLNVVGGQDEAIYTGVKGWLESKSPNEQVSKDELLKWMEDNRIEIAEVSKITDGALTNNWSQSRDNYAKPIYPLTWENAGWKVVENSKDSYSIFYPDGSQLTGEWSTKEGAFDRVRMIAPEGSTKYSQHQLEGEKKNYKEILVTLPKPAFKKGEWFAIPIEVDGFSGKEIIWRLKNKNTGQEGVGAYETKELAESEIKKGEKSGGKTDFKSTHFEEPNILVHLRMNTRADADYNKVLFLEEIQSDWGQKGKREGFRQDFVKARPDGENKWDVGGTKILYFEKGVDGKNYRTVNKDGEQVWSKTLDEANKVANERRLDQNRMGVQLAPFVTDTNAWTKLGLKVALREAVRQNADKLAWTTGEQQNERYDLSKSVDYVKNSGKTPNGDTYIDISLPQGLLNLHVNNNGIVTKQLGSMNIVDAEGKGLDEIIGKDVAEKILAAETNTTLKGEGLKVGGKGMKGFYGSPSEGSLGIVGGVAKKLFKQDIGTVVITTRENISSRDKIYEAYDRNGNVIKRGNSESYIKSIAEQNNGTYKLVDARQTSTQHSINITPELKAEVKQGLPKFQRVATFFSGAGTMEAALKKPESVIAVEYNPDYIKAYNEAFNMGYSAKNVIDVSPEEVADVNPDIFHASPVCKNFSKAKSFATVEELDLNSAIKVADVITEARPPVVTIENVPDYKNTAPYQVIVKALDEAGYTYDANIYNAADYGGTQDRKRLIIRATREGVLPPLPAKKKFRDWFTAIEDMIDSAPDSKFTSRTREESDELSRISNMIKSGKIDPSKPIITMGSSAYKGVALAVNSGNPSPTLLSSSKAVPRIIMPDGRVKRVTPEMMLEIMDLPSSYVIPSDWKTAKEVLGNGIDGAITRAIIEPMAELGERINQSGVKFQKPTRGMAIDKELADIKARSQSDGTFMKAPNGKKTNLNENQWLTVRTKSFKKWFGDWENNPEDASKIVDKNGEPLVVYHGTFTDKRDGEWYEFSLEGTRSFDVGFHFGTKTAAQDRINHITRNETDAAYSFMAKGRDVSKPRMIAAFLNIKNPIRLQEGERMPSWRGGEILSRIFDGIENESVDNNVTEAFEDDIEKYYEDELKVVYDEYGDGDLSEDAEEYPYYANVDRQSRWIEAYLKSKGFYGIVYENTIEDKGNDSYIVFNPNQIKSATENVGDFSAESPDIRFQKPIGKGAKNFDKWVGGNRLVTAQELQDVKSGEPIVVRAYHGTTNDFYEFDSSVKGNIEGHLGKLNYFTTDFQDASANYQSTGADLTNRIERRAEDIENFLEDEFDDFYKSKKELSKAYGYTANQLTALGSFSALAKDIAKKELQGGEERVLDVYIKLNNPVVLGNYYNKTWVDVINLSKSDLDEAAVEIADENDISVDEAKSDYESDIRQRAIENTGVESVHVKALERALKSNNYDIFYRGDLVSNIIGDDYFEESIELSAFENQMRKAGIGVNDEGEYAVGQVIADFFKNLGYDGIVLTDVSSRFRNMGLGGSTSHIHVFDDYSNQIKLADGSNVQFNEDTRDIRFQKPGEYKKAVEAAQAEVTNSVGAIFKLLGVDLGKPITRAKAIERRAKMQLPEIDPFKLFKKKYGEGAAKAIRTHVPSAMDYPQQFIDFIEKKVPLTQQIGRVVSEIPTLISADFQLLIGRDFKDRKITGKTPEEILKETDFTFHRIKSNEDMRVFRADYDDNEVVCTLRDPSRINDFLIFWVRNKYADSILPANKLTIEYLQGDTEGAKMWRRHLKDVHDFEVPSEEGLIESSFPNRDLSDVAVELYGKPLKDLTKEQFYNAQNVTKERNQKTPPFLRQLQDFLSNLEPSREDPYGRSSMSVQIGRGDDYIYKITNRYNHSASEPADSTLDKDLDNLVEGLQEAVLKLDEVTSIAIPGYKNTLPDGIIMDSERNYMAYDYSVDGEWYGTSYFSDYGFYVQDPSEPKTITKIDPNTQKIFMGVVFDTNKKTAMRWEGRNATELIQGADTIGLNIDKIQFSKNSVDIMTSKGGVRIEKDGDDFKLSGNITQIEDGFYFKVKGVKSIDFPNLVEIGDEFMRSSDNVTYLNMPRVKTVGNRFLAYNTGNYDSFNMQSLEHVEFEFGGIKYHDISFPSLISVGDNFAYGSNFLTFSAPKLEFVGNKFLSTSVGVRIYLPSLSEARSYFLSWVKGRSDLNSTYFWLPNLKKYGGRFLNGALVKEVFMPGANKLLPVQGADLYDLLDKYNEAKDDAYEYVRDNYPNISNFVTALEILNPENNFSYLRWMIDSSDAALKTMADDLGSYNRKIEGVRDFFKIGRADYNDERVFDFMISRLTKHGMRILEAGDYRLNDVSDIPTPVSESKPKFQRPIDQTYEKSQERLKPSTGMGLSGAEKAFIDRQAPLKRALIKANLNYARNLLISQAGSGARAYDFITTSFKNIYGGLTNDQIKNVDKLIFLRRVIQIDEYKAANPQAEKIVHPDNWDGLINNDTVVVDSAGNRKTMLSAKKALADMKSDLGVTEYNLIYNATERYFDTYKKILTDMFEAGLITQGLYDELKNLKYQPRVFINKILMRDENDPSEFRANLQDLSLRSAQIKKLTTGDVSEVIMDSRFLLAVSANSAYSRIAKNKTKREVAKGLGRPDTQDFMSSDKRTGFEEVIYYEDGIKKSFYLRGDLKSQLDDISSQIFQPEVAKWISTITGSRLIKLFATQANPLFILKNIPRDYQHVLFFTNIYDNTNIYNAMYLLARDYIKGAKGKLSNSADFKEFLEYGGGMNFLSTEDRKLMLSQIDLKKMNFSSVSTFILNRIESGLKKTTEGLGKLGELSEVAVRLGTYTKVRDNAIADFIKKNGRKPNSEEMDVIKTEAVVSARQIIDFAQGGSFTKNAELVMPYLNASFQGARVSTQYIFNNKIKFLTKILSLAPLVGAIALSNALIGDDDDMDKIPDTVKMMNFIILLPIKNEDGERHYLKIAKAQQLIPFLAAMELGATVTTEALIESSKTPRKDRAFSMQSVSKDKLEYIADAIGAYLPVNVLNKEVGVKELFSRVPAFSAYMAISGNYDAFYDQKVSYDFGEVSPEYEDVQNKKVQYFYKALAQGAADVHDVGAKRLQAGTEKFITGPNSSFVVSAAYAIANEVARASYDVKTDDLNLGRVVKEDEAEAIGARIASTFLNQAKMAVVRTTDKNLKKYIGREEVDEIILKENATSKALKDEANKLVKEARQEFSETGRYTNVEAKLKEYLKVIEEKGATNQDARRFVNLVKNKMRQVDSGDWPLYYDSIYWASSNRAKLEVIKRAFGEKMTKEDFVEFAKKYSVLTGEKIDREVYDSYFKTR